MALPDATGQAWHASGVPASGFLPLPMWPRLAEVAADHSLWKQVLDWLRYAAGA